ncbi:MAG TPA: GntR family transcriptional regulator [Bryobacteraceae bacterium]|nr:GntR family transcriptional regulator [Bryobacteraceae bacterium]
MERDVQLRIELASPVPVYRQIVEALRTYLVEGTLVPGDVLPSVRSLAGDLGIHFNTVAQAYRELAEEGWLDVSHGKSVRVIEREAPRENDEAAVEQFRTRIRRLIAEARAQGMTSHVVARELNALAGGLK